MHCSVYFTATHENVTELRAVYDLVSGLGVDFDFWPVNDAETLAICSPESIIAWKDAVDYISQRSIAVANRRQFYDHAIDYHAGAFKDKPLRCLGFVDQFGVKYDGSLIPCCVWGGDGLTVGNVLKHRYLFFGVRIRFRLRDILSGEGCRVGCYNHSLYEFSESTGQSFVLGS